MNIKTLTLLSSLAVSSLAHADTFYTDRSAWQTAAASNGPLLSGFSGLSTESYFYLGDCGPGRLADNGWQSHFNDAGTTLQFDAFHGKEMSAFGADFTLEADNGSLGLYFMDANRPTIYKHLAQSGFVGLTGAFSELLILPEDLRGLGTRGYGLGYTVADLSTQDSPTPEPASWLTMLTGLALLAVGLWRKHAMQVIKGGLMSGRAISKHLEELQFQLDRIEEQIKVLREEEREPQQQKIQDIRAQLNRCAAGYYC